MQPWNLAGMTRRSWISEWKCPWWLDWTINGLFFFFFACVRGQQVPQQHSISSCENMSIICVIHENWASQACCISTLWVISASLHRPLQWAASCPVRGCSGCWFESDRTTSSCSKDSPACHPVLPVQTVQYAAEVWSCLSAWWENTNVMYQPVSGLRLRPD